MGHQYPPQDPGSINTINSIDQTDLNDLFSFDQFHNGHDQIPDSQLDASFDENLLDPQLREKEHGVHNETHTRQTATQQRSTSVMTTFLGGQRAQHNQTSFRVRNSAQHNRRVLSYPHSVSPYNGQSQTPVRHSVQGAVPATLEHTSWPNPVNPSGQQGPYNFNLSSFGSRNSVNVNELQGLDLQPQDTPFPFEQYNTMPSLTNSIESHHQSHQPDSTASMVQASQLRLGQLPLTIAPYEMHQPPEGYEHADFSRPQNDMQKPQTLFPTPPFESTNEDTASDYVPINKKGKRGKKTDGPKRTCQYMGCLRILPQASKDDLCSRHRDKIAKLNSGPKVVPFMHQMTFEQAEEQVYSTMQPLVPKKLDDQARQQWVDDFNQQSTPEATAYWLQELLSAINTQYLATDNDAAALERAQVQHVAYQKNQESYNYKFHDQPHQYNMQKINARVRLLFRTAQILHSGGRLIYDEGGDNSGYSVDPDIRLSERLRRMCHMLCLDKRICMDIIEGRGVNAFVRDPHSYEKRKQDNVSSNSKKAAQRAAAAEAKKRKGDNQVTGDSKDEQDNVDDEEQPAQSKTKKAKTSKGAHLPPVLQSNGITLIADPPRDKKKRETKSQSKKRRAPSSTPAPSDRLISITPMATQSSHLPNASSTTWQTPGLDMASASPMPYPDNLGSVNDSGLTHSMGSHFGAAGEGYLDFESFARDFSTDN